jgi:hypothetical protein
MTTNPIYHLFLCVHYPHNVAPVVVDIFSFELVPHCGNKLLCQKPREQV